MKTYRSFSILFVALLISINILGQTDLNKPAAIDSLIRTGKLKNGLTYFIRNNKEPEKRASFYIIQNVGAILETIIRTDLHIFLNTWRSMAHNTSLTKA